MREEKGFETREQPGYDFNRYSQAPLQRRYSISTSNLACKASTANIIRRRCQKGGRD